jgi:hypothetical protein
MNSSFFLMTTPLFKQADAMNLIEKATDHAFHRDRLGKDNLRALGYRHNDSQEKRFQALTSWGDMSHSSILDLGYGCGYGYGNLQAFLDQHFLDLVYRGIDFLKEFIDGAAQRYGSLPNT